MRQAFIFIIACGLLVSCKHSKENTAGKGGGATLYIFPQRDGSGVNLKDMVVYIKYNAQSAPGGSYDDSAVCLIDDSASRAFIPTLMNGKYYIFSKGYDTATHQNVKGGVAYKIVDQKVQTVNVPVNAD